MHGLHLAHDLLDAQLVDRHDEKIGRIDGLLLAVPDDGPPRLAAILSGGTVLGARIGPRTARLVAAIRRRWGTRDAAPTLIPFDRVRSIGAQVKVDVEARALPSLDWERWLRRHVVCRIPGA